MAAPKAAARKPRRKEKKNIALGQAHIKSTFNNTIVSITDTSLAALVEHLLRLAPLWLARRRNGPVERALGFLLGAHRVVEVEPDERQEAVCHVRREPGQRHQHDPGERVGDTRQIAVDRGRHLGHCDQQNHDEYELGEDERDDEHRPLGDPAARGIPGGAGERERGQDHRDQ